jgi:hypothetical protein
MNIGDLTFDYLFSLDGRDRPIHVPVRGKVVVAQTEEPRLADG